MKESGVTKAQGTQFEGEAVTVPTHENKLREKTDMIHVVATHLNEAIDIESVMSDSPTGIGGHVPANVKEIIGSAAAPEVLKSMIGIDCTVVLAAAVTTGIRKIVTVPWSSGGGLNLAKIMTKSVRRLRSIQPKYKRILQVSQLISKAKSTVSSKAIANSLVI